MVNTIIFVGAHLVNAVMDFNFFFNLLALVVLFLIFGGACFQIHYNCNYKFIYKNAWAERQLLPSPHEASHPRCTCLPATTRGRDFTLPLLRAEHVAGKL